MALSKKDRRIRIKRRIRKRLSGEANRPRFSVFRSNKNIFVQLIDDIEGKTILSASSKNKEIADKFEISIKAVEKHITKALKIFKEEFKDFISVILALFIPFL